MVRVHETLLARRLMTTVHLAMAVLWAVTTLRRFTVAEPLVQGLRAVLATSGSLGSLRISVGDLVTVALTLWLTLLASRVLRFALDEDILPRLALPRGVSAAVSASVHYAVLLLGVFLALAAVGVDLSRFALLMGAIGVGIGFGLQNLVHNFVSGLILLFERPFHPGDTVEIGPLVGEVKRIGIRSSMIRTPEGAEAIVPNGNLISSQLVNWTLSDRHRRVDLTVSVARGSDPVAVMRVLVEAARAHPEVLADPAPEALLVGLRDGTLDFSLRFWTARFETWSRVRSEVALAVDRALGAAGIPA
jgi:small-conductance mechanosensitive channel